MAELIGQAEQDPFVVVDQVYQLLWRWADFELFIVSPTFHVIDPPQIILPAILPDLNGEEHVYPIYDYGYKLSTSKGEELYSAGMSMCKLYYTIEKMIYLLVDRLKSGGVDEQTEVQLAFSGHELAQRKGFEVIINLNYNVVVTNFDPGTWGERYLQMVRRLADKGYGYPLLAPRENYRQHPGVPTQGPKS